MKRLAAIAAAVATLRNNGVVVSLSLRDRLETDFQSAEFGLSRGEALTARPLGGGQ
jgi:hypothetical protein